jgi:hypothetical protein
MLRPLLASLCAREPVVSKSRLAEHDESNPEPGDDPMKDYDLNDPAVKTLLRKIFDEPIDPEGTVELYSTTLNHAMPLENVPDPSLDIQFIGDFDNVVEASDYADTLGCGWYLWSRPSRGKYLGAICITQGTKPLIREF